jgi:MFS family permease
MRVFFFFSGSMVGLMAGRLVVGLGIGISAVVVPTYTAEMAPPATRGALVSMYEAMLCVGMVAAAIVNYTLEGIPGVFEAGCFVSNNDNN